MSRILHLVNMGLRYGRSKGVRAYRQEEPPLGSLAAPCHLEESASPHFMGSYGRSKGVRAHRLEEPHLGNLAVPCHLEESASHHDQGPS